MATNDTDKLLSVAKNADKKIINAIFLAGGVTLCALTAMYTVRYWRSGPMWTFDRAYQTRGHQLHDQLKTLESMQKARAETHRKSSVS